MNKNKLFTAFVFMCITCNCLNQSNGIAGPNHSCEDGLRFGAGMILKVHAAEGDKDPIITLDTPCIVAEVDRFGPACKAGIRQGDIIDEIDGEPLIGKKLKSVIALLESEQEERILIILRGKRQSIEIVLERGK